MIAPIAAMNADCIPTVNDLSCSNSEFSFSMVLPFVRCVCENSQCTTGNPAHIGAA